jgi:hypothetical protein
MFLVGITVVVVLFLIVKESFSGTGTEAYQEQFVELGYYRNENNTGPVLRLYAYRALTADPAVMKEFADLLPHTKYGRTLVFFFDDAVIDSVTLSPKAPHISTILAPQLLATYEKTPMGEGRFDSRRP